jgi:Domain of unknown function (DUF4157)
VVERAVAGAGEPLSAPTRAPFERDLQHDFGAVRIHYGPEAAASARAIGASGYTVGAHIVLRDPPELAAPADRRLLAHELVHVLQQGDSSSSPHSVETAGAPSERQAADVAARVAGGEPLSQQLRPVPVAAGTIQCQDADEQSTEAPDWKKPSEDVAKYTKDALTIAREAAKQYAGIKRGAGDELGAGQLEEFAEHMDKGVGLVGTGTKGFEKIADSVELYTQVSEAYEQLKRADPAKDSAQAAQAFDKMFTTVGKLGQRLPKGPWKFYFDFLSHFGDGRGFFYSVSGALDPERRPELRDTSSEQGRTAGTTPAPPTPERSGRVAESTEPKPAAPVTLGTLKDDVENKYARRIKEMTSVGLFDQVSGAQTAKRQFDSAYDKLLAAKKSYDDSAVLGLHIFNREASLRASTALRQAAHDARLALVAMDLGEETFQPDMDALYELAQAHPPTAQ